MSQSYTGVSGGQKTATPLPPALEGTGSLFQAAEVKTHQGIKAKENASDTWLKVFCNVSPFLPGNKAIIAPSGGEGEH